MIYVPRDAFPEQVLDIVCSWLEILATGDYDAAFTAIAFHIPQET